MEQVGAAEVWLCEVNTAGSRRIGAAFGAGGVGTTQPTYSGSLTAGGADCQLQAGAPNSAEHAPNLTKHKMFIKSMQSIWGA